jgi:hypothetical protein
MRFAKSVSVTNTESVAFRKIVKAACDGGLDLMPATTESRAPQWNAFWRRGSDSAAQ